MSVLPLRMIVFCKKKDGEDEVCYFTINSLSFMLVAQGSHG